MAWILVLSILGGGTISSNFKTENWWGGMQKLSEKDINKVIIKLDTVLLALKEGAILLDSISDNSYVGCNMLNTARIIQGKINNLIDLNKELKEEI
jgi:hypothetical protein